MDHADTAAEPLIWREDARESDEDYDAREIRAGDEDGDAQAGESELVSPGLFIWILTFCAGVSGLLFGYEYVLLKCVSGRYATFLYLSVCHVREAPKKSTNIPSASSTGVISSTLVSINADLSSRPLTTLDKSLITSSTSLFALLVSPLTGLLADSLGRKKVILGADVLFIVGALWQAFTSSVWGMIAGRSIVGAAVGSASFCGPHYISPKSHPRHSAVGWSTVASLFITGGQVVAYLVGWAFSGTLGGWRWMVGLGALPAAVQLLMMGNMPETPRWLVKAGKVDMARRVLMRGLWWEES